MKDTNFIDNVNKTLKTRFLELSKKSNEIKILIAYFFLSGYNKVFENGVGVDINDKVKILVGLGTENNIIDAINRELNKIDDTKINVNGIENFINDLNNGKIEVRQTKEENHSKTYIFNFKNGEINERKVILGSSNFTERGLETINEMNYEIDNKQDTNYANDFFDELWETSLMLDSKTLVEDIKKLIEKSFITPKSPHDLFLKALYSIYGDYLGSGDNYHDDVLKKYDKYKYQDDAVDKGLGILKKYKGLILGDVVGLGKSIIASKILYKLGERERILILCSPALISQWQQYKSDFHYIADVQSIGKLDNIIVDNYDTILVDEAHNFRSNKTQRYENLHNICLGKKVILLSATIFNNQLKDIENLLYLFSPPDTKEYTGEPLQSFFTRIKRGNNKKNKDNDLFDGIVKTDLQELKEKILEKIMVRRTKNQIINIYSTDGISFPISKTERIDYIFHEKIENIFERTTEILGKDLSYARYAADNYLINQEQYQKNKNIAKSLIKTVILKRLESSVVAFKKTIDKVINNYEYYYKIVKEKKIVPKNKKTMDEYMEEITSTDTDLLDTITLDNEKFKNLSEYNVKFITDLEKDLSLLGNLKKMWEDITPDYDNKIVALRKKIKDFKEPFIIFTEAKDTAVFIYEKLKAESNDDNIILITGDDSSLKEKKKIIDRNFNANNKEQQENKYKILIATDVMAEGMNLHKANRVINYDLAWNPVIMMQRNGRINRVGSKHKTTYIYNIFPTIQIDINIKQMSNINKKITTFLELLGNDEKTLSDNEILNWDAYKCEETKFDDNESKIKLEYDNYFLNLLKKKVEKGDKLEYIIKLPDKIKSCKWASETNLLTFYKQKDTNNYGFIKAGKDIKIYDGLKLLECDEMELPLSIPKDFYEKQEENIGAFKEKLANLSTNLTKKEKDLISLLKEKNLIKYTDNVRKKQYNSNIEKIFEKLNKDEDISDFFVTTKIKNKKEIILNEYLLKE
jgi:superfamily II DNA/RNA helicase